MTLSDFGIDLKDYDIDLKNPIGRGAFGVVYKGVHKVNGSEVAVKKLKDPPSQLKDQQNLVRELATLASLKGYPGCLSLTGFLLGDSNSCPPTIVTPLMKNKSLKDALHNMSKSDSKFTPTKKTMSLYGICKTMSLLHSKNILHRDLKPENIFMDDNFEIAIGDFGSSRNAQIIIDMTLSVGTPIFMAPEMTGAIAETYTKAIDVYSFSVILYNYFVENLSELDDGKGHLTPINLLLRVSQGARLKRIDGKIPDIFWDLITVCWDNSPEKRPSFEEIANLFKSNKELWFEGTNEKEFMEYVQRMEYEGEQAEVYEKEQQAIDSFFRSSMMSLRSPHKPSPKKHHQY